MSSLFSKLQVYAGKWNLKSSTPLDEEDKSLFKGASVVSSNYGLSVCFFLKSGGQSYIPVSNNSKSVEVGDSVDLNKVVIETLSKEGEDDIMRVKICE